MGFDVERRKRGLFGLGILPVEPLPLFRQELGTKITGLLEYALSRLDFADRHIRSAGMHLRAGELGAARASALTAISLLEDFVREVDRALGLKPKE